MCVSRVSLPRRRYIHLAYITSLQIQLKSLEFGCGDSFGDDTTSSTGSEGGLVTNSLGGTRVVSTVPPSTTVTAGQSAAWGSRGREHLTGPAQRRVASGYQYPLHATRVPPHGPARPVPGRPLLSGVDLGQVASPCSAGCLASWDPTVSPKIIPKFTTEKK